MLYFLHLFRQLEFFSVPHMDFFLELLLQRPSYSTDLQPASLINILLYFSPSFFCMPFLLHFLTCHNLIFHLNLYPLLLSQNLLLQSFLLFLCKFLLWIVNIWICHSSNFLSLYLLLFFSFYHLYLLFLFLLLFLSPLFLYFSKLRRKLHHFPSKIPHCQHSLAV